MPKLKDKMILAIFCLSVSCLYAADPQETAVPDAPPVDIQIEQVEVYSSQPAQPQASQDESSRHRKSILSIGKTKSAQPDPASVTPKTSSEAAKMGWRRKSIQSPQPMNNAVKEVPTEIKAKRKRLKARMDRAKKVAVQKQNSHSTE